MGKELMNHSPYSVVSMLMRIKGQVTEEMLRSAANKVQKSTFIRCPSRNLIKKMPLVHF